MRLIDADKLFDELEAAKANLIQSGYNVEQISGLNMALCSINIAPTVEAVVLPCGYGQTVWAVGSKRIVECFVDEISFGVAGLFYLLSFDCDSDCDGCPFDSWKQDYMSGEWGCDGEFGQTGISGEEFGKTIFMTREEAEAALAGMKGGEGHD